jgi:diacylglycerol kinase (ATP)
MRIALIRNPESGSGEASDVAELLRGAGAGSVEAFIPADANEAPGIEPDRVAVAGGDGSIGCAAAAASKAGVPLAVVPVGTANDFARAHGLPDDLEEAARLAVEGRRTTSIELAWMGDRPFVNAASAGLAPVAAEKAHDLKGALGPAAYIVGALRAAATASPIPCRASCDGGELFAGHAWQVTVASSGSFGGGSDVRADPHDGMLDLVALEAGSRATLALRAYGLRRGTVEEQAGVVSRRCPHVDLEVPAATLFNVDGEVVESGPVKFTVAERALELVVP